MLGNLKLTQKGLLIISVPLLLQISFFTLYGDLLSQTEFLTRKEHREKNVIGRTNWITSLILAANLFALAKADNYVSDVDKRLEYCLSASMQNLKELTEVFAATDTAQLETLGEATKVSENLLKSTAALAARTGGDTAAGSKAIVTGSIQPSLLKLFELRHKLLETESRRYKIGIDSVAAIRKKKREFLTVGIVLDILIAVFIFWIFTKEITGRLGVLAKNNQAFAERKELSAPLSGSDEVAQLDKSFHEMAARIREAESRKQEYMQMISHDMRTPLTSVMCSLELLSIPDYNLSESGKRQLVKAEKELARVLTMINEILEIERLESGSFSLHKEIVSIHSLVSTALQSVEPVAAEAGIKLTSAVDETIEVFVDVDKLVRVLINLTANAVKFSPPNTTVAIEWFAKDKKTVRVQVKDQGRGIPPEFLGTIFERFKQVQVSDGVAHKGSGLGLSICKAIVEAHGGNIGVESQAGRGSTFWFDLTMEVED